MSSARSKYTKSSWYTGQKFDEHDNMFSMMDENRHTARRAQLASGVGHLVPSYNLSPKNLSTQAKE